MYHNVLRLFVLTLLLATPWNASASPSRSAAAVAPPYQVKDINAGRATTTALQLNFTRMATLGNTLFFSACPEKQCGLWKSDGTTVGTVQVAALDAKAATAPGNLMVVGGRLFFTDLGGQGLWRSDGTAAGTLKLADLTLPFDDARSHTPHMVDVNGTLFLITSNNELWKSNGSVAGTVRVKAAQSQSYGAINALTPVGAQLFFTLAVTDSLELWRSDGTTNGTARVQTFANDLSALVGKGNLLFFTMYNTNITSSELWKSDGTTSGTVRALEHFALDPDNSPGYGHTSLINVNDALFFYGRNDDNGTTALWKSDGTEAGTRPIPWTYGDPPLELTSANGLLFFCKGAGRTDGRCNDLWVSDGTDTGTQQLLSLDIVALRSYPYGNRFIDAPAFVPVNGRVFFAAKDAGGNSYDLWSSDGTTAGTGRVKDIPLQMGYPFFESDGTLVSFITNVNGTLFFEFDQQGIGENVSSTLWKSDGTATGTTQIAATLATAGSSHPSRMTDVNGTLFFTADDGVSGRELWKSDGTAAGTTRVKDIFPGTGSSLTEHATLFAVQNALYFLANNGVSGLELWKSDGTETGTMLVKDINPGIASAFVLEDVPLTALNGAVYFTASDGAHGYELWKSNGTTAGTVLVKDINPGVGDGLSYILSVFQNRLFFAANDGTSGSELWKSDGSAAGTVLVKDINVGANGSFPDWFSVVGATVFFAANDGTSGSELWKSDGSAAGTLLVKDVTPGTCNVNQQSEPCGTNFTSIQAVNGKLVFIRDIPNPTHTIVELWRSDGTATGTVLIKQLTQNTTVSDIVSFGAYGVFALSDAGIGELWRTDGTAAGTARINSLATGSYQQLFNVDGTLFFVVASGTQARELWRNTTPMTIGTSVKLQSFTVTDTDDARGQLVASRGRLFFSADMGNGEELWAFNLNGTNVQPRVFLPLARR